MPLHPLDRPVRFGRFEVDPARRTLQADGEPLPVGARAFDVLACLLQRRDRLVTKQELLDAVWPGLVVEEHNIATQIGTLRKLLGPQAIATIPGRGYRFAAVVDDGPAAGPAALAPDERLVPLIGREHDLAALTGLLASRRLVTVVGAGGMGKSLLARHLLAHHAGHWPNGACWVELASVGDVSALPSCIAQAVGVRLAGSEPVAALATAMAGLSMLVALDNAEHLEAGVAAVASALLAAAPGVRLLVTSQVPLRLPGEQVWRLAPLAVPPEPVPAVQAREFAAVALFVERARGADIHFQLDDARAADAVELCRRLDGLPLAIELAAVRAPLIGVQRLVAMLGNRLQLLTRSRDSQAPARQQTLRAALEWSHDLLDETERTVFRRLGLFVGSASLGMVQQVVADADGPLDAWAVLDALGALVDRSLVVVVPTGDDEPRYRLLESPRAFALEQLGTSGERERLRRRHAAAFAAQFDAAWHARWSGTVGVTAWQRGVLLDADNAREAIDAAAAADDAPAAVALAATLVLALPRHAQAERLRLCGLCESLAARLPPGPMQLRARLVAERQMYHAAPVYTPDGAARALELARALDRPDGDRLDLYLALCHWAHAVGMQAQPPLGALREAVAAIGAIERADWPPQRLAEGLEARRLARIPFDDAQRAADLLDITRRQFAAEQAAGADTGELVARLMDAELVCGHTEAAVELGERELARRVDSRDEWGRFTVQANLALAHLLRGDAVRARVLLADAWPVALRFRMHVFCSDLPALMAALEGRPRAAAQLQGYADAQWEARNFLRHPNEETVRERCLARVRGALGSEAADALVVQGRALRDEAVAPLAFADGADAA